MHVADQHARLCVPNHAQRGLAVVGRAHLHVSRKNARDSCEDGGFIIDDKHVGHRSLLMSPSCWRMEANAQNTSSTISVRAQPGRYGTVTVCTGVEALRPHGVMADS